MYKLIEFLRRIYVLLLFIIIEAVALNYYAHSTYYNQAKILARAGSVVGGVQSGIYNLKHYFTLGRENEMLTQRIADLENRLAYYTEREADLATDSLAFDQMDSLMAVSMAQFSYIPARIVSSTIHHTDNFMTLNRGLMHGVREEMAAISPNGVMVGYVVGCSERYSVVKTLLNTKFLTSGKVAGDDYYGSISWSGRSPYKVEMTELSKYADIEVGDEIISSGKSHYFPEGIKIGFVESYQLNENQTFYDVVIRLAVDITGLNNVLLINNADYGDISDLESTKRDEIE